MDAKVINLDYDFPLIESQTKRKVYVQDGTLTFIAGGSGVTVTPYNCKVNASSSMLTFSAGEIVLTFTESSESAYVMIDRINNVTDLRTASWQDACSWNIDASEVAKFYNVTQIYQKTSAGIKGDISQIDFTSYTLIFIKFVELEYDDSFEFETTARVNIDASACGGYFPKFNVKSLPETYDAIFNHCDILFDISMYNSTGKIILTNCKLLRNSNIDSVVANASGIAFTSIPSNIFKLDLTTISSGKNYDLAYTVVDGDLKDLALISNLYLSLNNTTADYTGDGLSAIATSVSYFLVNNIAIANLGLLLQALTLSGCDSGTTIVIGSVSEGSLDATGTAAVATLRSQGASVAFS